MGNWKKNQQITTEVGYSYFDLKDKWLTEGVNAYYGGFMLYGGYRYKFHNFFIEPQVGVAFYQLNGYSDVLKQGVEANQTYFDWALGAGYNLGHFDLAIRYQSAQVQNSNDINFIGLRLGYRFYISKESKEQKH